jgi:hypothetical protein
LSQDIGPLVSFATTTNQQYEHCNRESGGQFHLVSPDKGLVVNTTCPSEGTGLFI